MSDVVDFDQRRRRERYPIVISAGIWLGFDAAIELPTSAHPVRHFKVYAEAMAYAEELARLEGWPVISSVPRDDDPPGPRAA